MHQLAARRSGSILTLHSSFSPSSFMIRLLSSACCRSVVASSFSSSSSSSFELAWKSSKLSAAPCIVEVRLT